MSEEKPTEALIKLDGTRIAPDGTLTKVKYFERLHANQDDYSDITFTEAEAKKINSYMCSLKTGSVAAIPLICGGNVCPFKDRCPYYQMGKAPIARQCCLELDLLREWITLYIDQFDVDPKNFIDIQNVTELAEIELMLWRLNNNLAKPEHASLIEDTVVGTDKEGHALTRKEPNAFLRAKESLNNRKSKVMVLMVGTRQEKYKQQAALKTKDLSDPSMLAAKIKQNLKNLLVDGQKAMRQIEEQDGSMIEGEVVSESPVRPEDLLPPK